MNIDFTQNLITYYKGERFEALLLVIFGSVMLVIAILMWQNMSQNQMLRGLFYPMSFLAIFTLSTGGFGVYNNSHRLQKFPSQFISNAKEFVENELNRFEGKSGVNKWWMPLKVTWAILVLFGLTLSFGTKSELINGLAIGLILIGSLGFIIDGFAHQRAKVYTDCLIENYKIFK